jgi:hypothetical protein
MKKKKYSESERMYFVQAYNDSGLNLNEFSIMNKVDFYDLKRWLKDSYHNSNYDAGDIVSKRSTQGKPKKKNIKIDNSNGIICFSPATKKPNAILIKNNGNQFEPNYLTDRINFRDDINECCCKLLDLSYRSSNIDLIEKLMEVLN